MVFYVLGYFLIYIIHNLIPCQCNLDRDQALFFFLLVKYYFQYPIFIDSAFIRVYPVVICLKNNCIL